MNTRRQNREQKGLLAACSEGDVDFLKLYIEENQEQLNYEVFDNHKWGPLHHAVASGSLECVKLLLDCGFVDTKHKSHEGYTCLFLAVERNSSKEIIVALVRANAKLYNIPNNEMVYPMHKAALINNLKAMKAMTETLKELNVKFPVQFDLDQENCLILAARMKNIEMIDYLLTLNEFDVKYSCGNGLNAIIASLLGADRYVENIEAKRFQIVKKLLPITYDLTSDNCIQQMLTFVYYAMGINQKEIYDWLLNRFYLNEKNIHRELIVKLQQMPNFRDRFELIAMLLHSKIVRLWNNVDFYAKLLSELHNLFTAFERSFFKGIVAIIRPTFYDTFTDALAYKSYHIHEKNLDDMMEIFHILRFGDLLNKRSLVHTSSIVDSTDYEIILKWMVPFLDEPTLDGFFEKFRCRSMIHIIRLDEMPFIRQYCIEGQLCDLKSLSRAAIRKYIFKDEYNPISNQDNVDKIHSLNLPNSLKNYLLFNNSEYDLTTHL